MRTSRTIAATLTVALAATLLSAGANAQETAPPPHRQ